MTANPTASSSGAASARAGPVLAADRALALACLALLALVLAALLRSAARWGDLPPLIWAHLISVTAALALAPVLLWNIKGTTTHRALGRLWAGLMLGTAALSLVFNAGSTQPGSLGVFSGDVSPIHLLSVLVLAGVPRAVVQARRGNIVAHPAAIPGLVIGGLILAGSFTFPFGRQMGVWLLS